MAREILTLQFGNYSNYVGTHWWNLQESGFVYDPSAGETEINHDVLFREGKNFKGETTFTPRLLVVDQKGVLKHYPEQGELYEAPIPVAQDGVLDKVKECSNWDANNIEVVKNEPIEKPEYQRDMDDVETVPPVDKDYEFNKNVTTWTDYMYSRYHPRSITLLNNCTHSSEHNEFDTFTIGQQTWKENFFGDEFADKIRQYIEECDNCQGFQVMFDCTDGFAGLALQCLEHINDDYSYSVFGIPFIPPKVSHFKNADTAMSDSIRVINTVMTYSGLKANSSLFLPLSTMTRGWRQISLPRRIPALVYDTQSYYHTSAILASYLDTITIPYRLKSGSNNLPGFTSDLNNYGRKLAGGALGLPFQMSPTEDLIDCLDKMTEPIFMDISPNTKIGTDEVIQSVSVRGIPQTRLKRPRQHAQKQMQMNAYRCESVSEMFQLYFQCKNYRSMTHVSSIKSALPIKTPYPVEIFDTNLTFDGFTSEFELPTVQKVVSAPVIAAIQNSSKISDTIEGLHREAKRIKIAKIHRFQDTGLEQDDYVEVLEKLLEFKENYEDAFEL